MAGIAVKALLYRASPNHAGEKVRQAEPNRRARGAARAAALLLPPWGKGGEGVGVCVCSVKGTYNVCFLCMFFFPARTKCLFCRH